MTTKVETNNGTEYRVYRRIKRYNGRPTAKTSNCYYVMCVYTSWGNDSGLMAGPFPKDVLQVRDLADFFHKFNFKQDRWWDSELGYWNPLDDFQNNPEVFKRIK